MHGIVFELDSSMMSYNYTCNNCYFQLMVSMGLVSQTCSGVYHILPMGYRVLEKLTALIDQHLQAIGAVKMAMPMLTPRELWEESGNKYRWAHNGMQASASCQVLE